METLLEALRSAIGAAGDYGIWIGILAFILVLAYGFRKKPEQEKEQDAVIQERIARNQVLGGIIAILLTIGLLWYAIS